MLSILHNPILPITPVIRLLGGRRPFDVSSFVMAIVVYTIDRVSSVRSSPKFSQEYVERLESEFNSASSVEMVSLRPRVLASGFGIVKSSILRCLLTNCVTVGDTLRASFFASTFNTGLRRAISKIAQFDKANSSATTTTFPNAVYVGRTQYAPFAKCLTLDISRFQIPHTGLAGVRFLRPQGTPANFMNSSARALAQPISSTIGRLTRPKICKDGPTPKQLSFKIDKARMGRLRSIVAVIHGSILRRVYGVLNVSEVY